jgi:hypothetical protein
MMEPIAHQSGLDLRAILDEAAARKEKENQLLTERLQESVVPLFIYRDGQPDRIGSCVLVRLDSDDVLTSALIFAMCSALSFLSGTELFE